MPVVGQHESTVKTPLTPKSVRLVVMLTHERPGLLGQSLTSLRAVSPDLQILVYDDGSELLEKRLELQEVSTWENVQVLWEPHRGLVSTWCKIAEDLHQGLYGPLKDDDGIVLLEDDLLFAKGWDEVMLKMAAGCAALGLKPGAMTCFRCHESPQAEIRDLNGIRAYQSMQHGFQVNLMPAHIFRDRFLWNDAAFKSQSGIHGLDVWLIGGMSHYLDLTSFMSESSWVAHVGAGQSVAEEKGYIPFRGMGYELVPELHQQVIGRMDGLF